MANRKMKSIVRISLIVLLSVLLIIQFIHPAKNISTTVSPKDIAVIYPMPDSVHQILQKACYDCHSNNTRYPWYNNIQPVAWWLNHHIEEGRKELNFSEFGSRTLPKQAKKLKKVVKEIQEGGMPLDSYTWIHKDAILTGQEKNILIDWATGLSNQIAAQGPVQN
jgi:hypothetical protein